MSKYFKVLFLIASSSLPKKLPNAPAKNECAELQRAGSDDKNFVFLCVYMCPCPSVNLSEHFCSVLQVCVCFFHFTSSHLNGQETASGDNCTLVSSQMC